MSNGAEDSSNAKPQSGIGKLASSFVDFVNPKFKFFNRPLFLAILVGGLTSVFTLILYFEMMKVGAREESASTPAARVDGMIENLGATCIHSPQSRLGIYTDEEGHEGINYFACVLVEEEVAGAPTWCNADEKAAREAFLAECRTIHADGPDPDVCNCRSAKKSGWSVLHFYYDVTPDQTSTLGAALGYAGFIELLVTIAVIGVLSKVGYINKDSAYFKELIEQANEKHGTALEVGGVMDVPQLASV